MALVLLTKAEIGEQSDVIINTQWIVSVARERTDLSKVDLNLTIIYAVHNLYELVDVEPKYRLLKRTFLSCPDPDAVMRKIFQAQ